jgi:PhnB protein
MNIVPYLWFNGTCAEAFRFYEEALGGQIIDMLPHRGTPMSADVPADWQDKIMHAMMNIGDSVLMASDVPPAHYKPAQGLSVSLHVKTADEAERVFKALAAGGTVTMPMEKTFWADRFGMLVDRFGTPWMINCDAAPV